MFWALSRASDASQRLSFKKKKFHFQNKSRNEILLGIVGPGKCNSLSSLADARATLASYGARLPADGEPSLNFIANILLEFTTAAPGITPLQTEIIRAIVSLLDSAAIDCTNSARPQSFPRDQISGPEASAKSHKSQVLALSNLTDDLKNAIAASTKALEDCIKTTHTALEASPPTYQPQSSDADIDKANSSLHSSPHSSHAWNSEVDIQLFTEEDHLSELPFEYSTATVRRTTSYPTQHGSFADIWVCELISEHSPCKVAVKVVKTGANDDKDLRSYEKKLRRELRVWERLRHRNIVPLLGVVSGFGPLPSMVSPWFSNGSLSRYLAHHQTLSLSKKHQLLKDTAAGLSYLHSQGVIHGDLHSDNVLINEDGTACLTDFSLSLIMDFVGTTYLKSSICGGVQFTDPALVQRIDSSQDTVFYPTKPCDVYSFGGLILHVLSGKKPYEEIHSVAATFVTILRGVQPQIPTHDKHITQWHRLLIQRCWDPKEPKRPLADDLVTMFEPQ